MEARNSTIGTQIGNFVNMDRLIKRKKVQEKEEKRKIEEKRRKSKLLSPKHRLKIGTWNVRTMDELNNEFILFGEMNRYKVDIVGVTETHTPGNGAVTTKGGLILFSGRKDKDHRQGVAVAISNKMKSNLLSHKCINERLMSARFQSAYINLSIIVCYTPTNDAEMEEKNSFYDQLQDEINATPKHDLIMVIGDLNAKVGSDNLAWKMTMGKHGVGNKNENGVRLLEFCTTNDLIIGGTLFEHQEKHKTTWHAKNKNKKCYSNQIDHIMISGRWRRSLADVRAFRGATIGSDHYLNLPPK